MKVLKLVWISLLLVVSLNAQDKKYQLTQVTYDGINKVQKFLDLNNTKEAKETLKALENSSKVRKKLDKAYIRFYFGYFYTLNNDLKKASYYFKEALKYKALAPEQTISTYLNLVQIYMSLELYNDALYNLDELIENSKIVNPMFYINKANIYMILTQYDEVIKNIDLAINLEHKRKEDWLKMKYYSYFMLKDYKMAIKTLESLLKIDANSKEYWLQLSSLYSLTNNVSLSLSSLDVPRIAKLQLNQSELVRLVSWLRYSEMPFKAAKILENNMSNNKLQNDKKNLNLLGDLYYEAKEYDKAIYWYTKSAQMSNNLKIYFKIAQIYLNMHDYTQAIKNIKLSVDKNLDEDNNKKYLYLGKAYYEIDDIISAKIAFKKALLYTQSKKMAEAWLVYLK